jgi:hypothetical protein
MTTVADAMRTRATFLYGVVGVCVLTAVVSGCGEYDDASKAVSETTIVETTTTVALAPVAVGESATVDGVVVTVTNAEVTDSVNEGLARGRFLVVDVTLTNRGEGEVAYSPQSWSLHGGRAAISVYPISDLGRLEFGTLAPGATVEGIVGFDLGPYEGPAQVQYRPPRTDGMAAWSVTL